MLLDRVGTRWALVLALVVIAASNVLRGLAVGHVSLFLAVALFGLGGPLVSVGAPKTTALWFDGRERGFAMGVYITGLSLGNMAAFSLANSVLMPLFDGDWRAVLLADAAFGLVIGLVWLAITAHPVYRAVEARPVGQVRESPDQNVRRLGAGAGGTLAAGHQHRHLLFQPRARQLAARKSCATEAWTRHGPDSGPRCQPSSE